MINADASLEHLLGLFAGFRPISRGDGFFCDSVYCMVLSVRLRLFICNDKLYEHRLFSLSFSLTADIRHIWSAQAGTILIQTLRPAVQSISVRVRQHEHNNMDMATLKRQRLL